MDVEARQPKSQTDQDLQFALLFFVAWMITVVLPRLAATALLSVGDGLVALPAGLAAGSMWLECTRTRVGLRLIAIPLSLIFVGATRAPAQTPSSLPWVVMAAVSLAAYWLWVLEHVAKKKPIDLQVRPMQRVASLSRPKRLSVRSLVMPVLATLAGGVVFVAAPYFASSERRAFVLTMAAAFVVIAAIGGLAPMLRQEKRRADRSELRRRALVMFLYAAACLAILWGYLQYRQI